MNVFPQPQNVVWESLCGYMLCHHYPCSAYSNQNLPPLTGDCRPTTQMKSLQFRSIAPKAPTVTPSSAVVSCQSPASLPEASTPANPKSILVSGQNYALMQVAGQDGTFSLVAVSQTPPPNHMQKNLKLPIPRYQPVRGKRSLEKISYKTRNSSKLNKTLPVKTNSSVSCSPDFESASELMSGTEISLPDKGSLYKGSLTVQPVQRNVDSLISYPAKPSTTTLVGPVSNTSPVKVQAESSVSAGSITVLSPTIFSKAVQIIHSPPKGKIPILPYAKVKDSLLSSTGLTYKQSSKIHSSNQANRDIANNKNKTSDWKNENEAISQDSDTTHLRKLSGIKPGRKRKTMDDILTFEARKKRSLTFFSRRGADKMSVLQSSSSQNKLVDISKKYRSIRPKPVFMIETNVPQLVPIVPHSASENPHQHHQQFTSQEMSGKPENVIQAGPVSMQVPEHQAPSNSESSSKFLYVGNRALHRCSTCSKCFRFKHHLQSHMISHSNLRPYSCPVCRKAYVHSGSLSTHMNLHHSEGKPRKSLRCEFCEKAFGYVGVYFSHLREVHRVILTVEPCVSQHEELPPTEG